LRIVFILKGVFRRTAVLENYKKKTMKNILTFLILLISYSVVAQPNEGAIKTKNGFLWYSIQGINSHTLNLEGTTDLTKFPFIKQNNIWFQFLTANSVDFGKEPKSILTSYMNWELDFLQKEMDTQLKFNNEFKSQKGLTTNFWKFINPEIKDNRIHAPVKATYCLDFINKGLVFRLSYASKSGNDSEAETILLNIFHNFRFYDKNIDLDRLRKNVLQGKNFY
jgi:hypothetical protein